MAFNSELARSLITGYVDHTHESNEALRPKLLVNNHLSGQKVLTNILNELDNCEEFFFSVAFITYSGLVTMLNTLEVLEKKNIKGKVVASNYLNFTEPKALEKLLEFKNIELRVVVGKNLHSKGYIFRKSDQYSLIVGSSNLTQNALSYNKEWNLKVSSKDQGSIVMDTLQEFDKTFNSGIEIDSDWIEQYSKIYRYNKKQQIKESLQYAADSNALYNTTLIPKVVPNSMQVEALKGIQALRDAGEKKALLISATGTGKTYLACFDVAKAQPKRLLFLVHREQILDQSIESFKNVLGYDIDVGKVGGGKKEFYNRFVFSTVQTMSKKENHEKLDLDHFDYIVVDESHRAGADSYRRILDYFNPEFLLGMTATPERTDDYNICEEFDYNIAYEIRLEQAMREEMLCPFHYFGITEMKINGEEIDENSEFRYLVSSERIDHIQEKIKFYGHDGDRVKGLIFCSRNEEARELSDAFNKRGYNTIALSGANTQEERAIAINRLESDETLNPLDYIFTVDIFNEGVDIPQVNQVVMLRPTKSAIVFVQQLGRGLRKYPNKDFVVVLDFIGNYQNNFMIPIALSDDRSFNKDSIRRFVAEGNRVIPGCTTINFDAIAKKKIYDSIDSTDFTSIKYIKESYKNLKYRLGRIPKLMDFEHHDSMDIARLFESSVKSYYKFLVKNEKEYDLALSEQEEKFIECISVKFAKGKRPHELLILKAILENNNALFDYMIHELNETYSIEIKEITYINVYNILTNKFATGASKKTYEACPFVEGSIGNMRPSEAFKACLDNPVFKSLVSELLELGLYRTNKYYGKRYHDSSFQLYQKYTYEDVCTLLEWEKNMVSLNIGGYKYDEFSKTYPVFINYHKSDDISDTIKYEDRFINNEHLIAISKSKRTVDSNDVKTAYSAKEKGIRMELFVRKSKDDKGSKEFYYLGRMEATGVPNQIVVKGVNQVELFYKLDQPVREDIYDYLTEEKLD